MTPQQQTNLQAKRAALEQQIAEANHAAGEEAKRLVEAGRALLSNEDPAITELRSAVAEIDDRFHVSARDAAERKAKERQQTVIGHVNEMAAGEKDRQEGTEEMEQATAALAAGFLKCLAGAARVRTASIALTGKSPMMIGEQELANRMAQRFSALMRRLVRSSSRPMGNFGHISLSGGSLYEGTNRAGVDKTVAWCSWEAPYVEQLLAELREEVGGAQ